MRHRQMKVVIGLGVNDVKIVPKAGFPLSQQPMKALHKEPSALVLEPIAPPQLCHVRFQCMVLQLVLEGHGDRSGI